MVLRWQASVCAAHKMVIINICLLTYTFVFTAAPDVVVVVADEYMQIEYLQLHALNLQFLVHHYIHFQWYCKHHPLSMIKDLHLISYQIAPGNTQSNHSAEIKDYH